MKTVNRGSKSPYKRIVKIKTESTFFSTLKTLLILAVIATQVALLVCMYLWLMEAFVWYIGISFVLSFGTCLYVVSTERNGYSKSIWTMFLLIFFEFGWFFYLISDESIFFKKSKKRYNQIFARNKFLLGSTDLSGQDERVVIDANYLKNVASFPICQNSSATYYKSGTLLIDEILEQIKQAKHFIFIEYYIIADGVLLSRFIKVLEEKVKQGVTVRIIYDDMGCHGKLKRKTKKYIKNAGIALKPFNRIVPIFNIAMNFRDHRKIVIVDGKVAFTGGANLADEYINEKRMHGYWKDAGIKVQGKAVDSFTTIFLRQWEFVSKTSEDYASYLNLFAPTANTALTVPYADGLEYGNNIGKNMYLNVISKAQKIIYITTPYLILEEAIFSELKNKAMAGVDVRILIPEVADKSYVYKISINNAEKLSKFGVKIYKLNHSFVHSKNVLTDYCAIVGTINMDLRSFYQQFETAVYTTDAKVLESLKNDFDESFKNSTILEIKKHSLFSRIITGLLRIFSPLM